MYCHCIMKDFREKVVVLMFLVGIDRLFCKEFDVIWTGSCKFCPFGFKEKLWEKLQTNINSQTFSLVSNIYKLFRKLTSGV